QVRVRRRVVGEYRGRAGSCERENGGWDEARVIRSAFWIPCYQRNGQSQLRKASAGGRCCYRRMSCQLLDAKCFVSTSLSDHPQCPLCQFLRGASADVPAKLPQVGSKAASAEALPAVS